MQPTYLPWIGYFDLIDQVDIFVFYDDVQYVKGQWGSRNRIKTSNGETFLTALKKKYPLKTNYNQIELINDKPWKKKQLKTLFYTYQKAPFFKEVYSFLEKELNQEYQYLAEMNISLIKKLSKRIGIDTVFMSSSRLESKEGVKDIRTASICKELNCTIYLSPIGASAYIEKNQPGGEFRKNNINLFYQNYLHPVYNQFFGDFKSHMSIVDLLFYEGFSNSLNILTTGRKEWLKPEQIKQLKAFQNET